jgi:quercetin dioxygenase-like cupin family protein
VNTKTKTGLAAATTIAMAVLGSAALAEGDTQFVMKDHEGVVAPGVEWKPAKSIPAGATMVLLYGDPSKPGPYIFRVRFPAGYKLPAHKHDDPRWVTVLKGNYWSASGDAFDQGKLKKFGPRDAYSTEAGVTHFAWAETDVVIQEMGIGPISNPLEYANAADDPRGK